VGKRDAGESLVLLMICHQSAITHLPWCFVKPKINRQFNILNFYHKLCKTFDQNSWQTRSMINPALFITIFLRCHGYKFVTWPAESVKSKCLHRR